MLRKALALDPRFAAAQTRLAYRLAFMGYSTTIRRTSTRASPRPRPRCEWIRCMPGGYFVLGSAYAMKGRDAQSRQAFLRALELNPNNIGAMHNFSDPGDLFGRLDDAAYWGRRGFGLSGKRANDYYHLIVPLLSLRADAVTRTLLEDAERRFPTFPRVQILFSLLELFEGQVERAASRTKELVARSPENEEVKIHRADMAFLLDSPDLESALEPLMQRSAGELPDGRGNRQAQIRVRARQARRVRESGRPRRRGRTGRARTHRRRQSDARVADRARRRGGAPQGSQTLPWTGSRAPTKVDIVNTRRSSATRSWPSCGPTRATATCSIACGATSTRSALAPANGDCSTSRACSNQPDRLRSVSARQSHALASVERVLQFSSKTRRRYMPSLNSVSSS